MVLSYIPESSAGGADERGHNAAGGLRVYEYTMSSSSPSPLSSVILAIEGLLVTLPHVVVGLGATTLALLAATYYLSSSRSSSASSNNTPSHDAPSRASSSWKAAAAAVFKEGGDGRRGSRTDEVDDELDATVSSDVRGASSHPPGLRVWFSPCFLCAPPHSPRNTLLSNSHPPRPLHPSIHPTDVGRRPPSSSSHIAISLPPEIM